MFKSKWSMILTYSGKLEYSAGSSLLWRASDKGCLHISTTVFCSINCLTFFPRIPETAQSHGFPPVMRGSSLCSMNRELILATVGQYFTHTVIFCMNLYCVILSGYFMSSPRWSAQTRVKNTVWFITYAATDKLDKFLITANANIRHS